MLEQEIQKLTLQGLCDKWNNTFDSYAWVHKGEIIIKDEPYTREEFIVRLVDNLLAEY